MSLVPTVLLDVDAAELAARLSQARSLLHDSSAGTPREVIASVLSAEQIARLRSRGANKSVSDLEAVLTEAETELQALPVVTLTVAQPLRARFQRSLVDWFDRNGLGPARLEFKVDPALVGGLVLGVAGHRYDYSVLKDVTAFVEKK